MRPGTIGQRALAAAGGRLSVWISGLQACGISWLQACSKATGLALLGLVVVAYLDIWTYQAVSGLQLLAGASPGKLQADSRFRYAPGQPMGWLEIPRLGVSAIVAQGDDTRTLMRAIGHIPGTALPGEGGNVGLAGHRDTFFRGLGEIEPLDTIRLVMPGRAFAYRVVDAGVVKPSQVEVLDPTAESSLTLVTCYPFEYVGPAPYRYVVRAQEVDDLAPRQIE